MFDIGTVPWTDRDLRSSFDKFLKIYEQRPIQDNQGGMKLPHAFLTWFICYQLQPEVVIESGVFKGQGTWLIKKACPNVRLICIDPCLERVKYQAPEAEYRKEDFTYQDFSELDKDKTLCFFDDHMSAYDRLVAMKWMGFKKAIFEDNYVAPHGDCYSLRRAFCGDGFNSSLAKTLNIPQLDGILRRVDALSSVPPNAIHKKLLMQNLLTYWEGPPIYRTELTRWGDVWSDDNYPTKPALFEHTNASPYLEEAQDYTWLCYVELK